MNIKSFNKDYFCYLIPQRTRITTEYQLSNDSSQQEIDQALTTMMLKDYNMIKSYLPETASNILDIGCGLGLIDIALYHHYDQSVNLCLLDKTNNINEDTHIRGFNKEYVFYNSMDSTRDTLQTNGVSDQNIITYEVNDENLDKLKETKFDVIMSLLSCGWHYSIETYIDLIKNTLSTDGILILDIRHNTGQLEYAKQHFDLIDVVINTAESKHTGGTIGDRYIFKLK
jgi:SAM-dependent methyltransferase